MILQKQTNEKLKDHSQGKVFDVGEFHILTPKIFAMPRASFSIAMVKDDVSSIDQAWIFCMNFNNELVK